MRPASLITNTLFPLDCDTNIFVHGTKINAKSIMNLMAACIKCGTDITLVCEGPQEKEALAAFDELYNKNFDE